MARSKATIQQELETTRRRLDAYLEREADMLAKNGVQSYGIGSRNIQYYSTALKDIQDMIEKLRARIRELEAELEGRASQSVGSRPARLVMGKCRNTPALLRHGRRRFSLLCFHGCAVFYFMQGGE